MTTPAYDDTTKGELVISYIPYRTQLAIAYVVKLLKPSGFFTYHKV
jgi:hypothetical protein